MAGRPKHGLGWQEFAHHWTGTTYRAASLDSGCSEWSWDKDTRMGPRERLIQAEGGVSYSQRTGPNRTMIQDVPLEVGHA